MVPTYIACPSHQVVRFPKFVFGTFPPNVSFSYPASNQWWSALGCSLLVSTMQSWRLEIIGETSPGGSSSCAMSRMLGLFCWMVGLKQTDAKECGRSDDRDQKGGCPAKLWMGCELSFPNTSSWHLFGSFLMAISRVWKLSFGLTDWCAVWKSNISKDFGRFCQCAHVSIDS